MSKVLKIVALVVVAVAVIVFAPQIAGFIGHSIFGVAAGAAGATTIAAITSTVIGIGISIGLSALGSLFRKSATLSNSIQDRLNTTVVPAAPRKIVFGTTAAGNDCRFFETWGSKKDNYTQVIALASHKVSAIKQWYAENDLTWNGSAIVHNNAGFFGFYAHNGSDTTGFACGSQTYWQSTARFTGCAYLIIDYKLGDPWPSGIPNRTTTIVDGCPLYDPRLDSTRGGSGPHRIEDHATWSFTSSTTGKAIGRNPALCLLAYLRGWRINDKLAWGMGVDPTQINFDNFKLYANVCEEDVLTASNTSVQRYTCDGIFATSDTHESIINSITAAMGSCKLSDVGGLYRLIGGYDDTLGPIQALNDDDIIGGVGSPSPYHWQPAGPTNETYNIARGRFPDPTNLYQLTDWGVVNTDTLPDGIDRTLTLDLGAVCRAETCQRIAKQFLLREALGPGFFSATFAPRAFAVEVGSLVRLTVRSRGWNGKLFRVESQKEVHDMVYDMILREEDPGIYAWDREEKPLPPSIIPPGYDPKLTITPQIISVTARSYQGA